MFAAKLDLTPSGAGLLSGGTFLYDCLANAFWGDARRCHLHRDSLLVDSETEDGITWHAVLDGAMLARLWSCGHRARCMRGVAPLFPARTADTHTIYALRLTQVRLIIS